MQLHKYENIWLVFGIVYLVVVLLLRGFVAFCRGTHSEIHGQLIDSENIEANDAFKPENLGITKVDDDKYIVNIVASAFNYDLGEDEDGEPVKHIRIPKGSTVLFQATSPDVVHGLNVAGTN